MTLEKFLCEYGARIQVTCEPEDRGRIVAVILEGRLVYCAGDGKTIDEAMGRLRLNYEEKLLRGEL